jgi:hypothetical protein
MTTGFDPRTGRPLTGQHEEVENLADDQLEIELTIAAYDTARRPARFERLAQELLRRTRQGRRTDTTARRGTG